VAVPGVLAALALWCGAAGAEAMASAADSTATRVPEPTAASPVPVTSNGLEPLVPELADHPYRLEPGVRPFRHRLTVSPSYGFLGAERLFALRVGYNPDPWLGYEASIGHNPGQAVHAVLHTFSAILRLPLPGRLQPYAAGGYGMVMVYPGRSVNADPVTKNTLTAGGGLELYIRSDLALRADLRHATVFGKQKDRDDVVAYGYLQGTIGLAFYRSVRP
jgi:hypothetical protein